MSTTVTPSDTSSRRAATGGRRPPGRQRSTVRRSLRAMPWMSPVILLIATVILIPVLIMVRSSLQNIDAAGVSHGWAGLLNYRTLFNEPALGEVMTNTILWVVLVVGISVAASLALAQFLNKQFLGRRLVRWALIVPWAAALVMTSTVWRFMLQGSNGIINRILMDLGITSQPIGFYQDPAYSLWSVIFVGIVVTIPFTTYVILAGLQTIPSDVYEAAEMDGATGSRTYWSITFPLLRPALTIATILVFVSVFNSFPVIWVITGANTGNTADTTITWAYKIAFRQQLNTGEAAALSVLNVFLLCIVVFIYLRVINAKQHRRSLVHHHIVLAVGRAKDSVLVRTRCPAASRAHRRDAAWRGPLRRGWSRGRPVALPTVGLLIGLFFLFPYIVMFLSSVKSGTELFQTPATYLPRTWVWSNWSNTWNEIALASFLKSSLIVAVCSTALVFLVSVPAAYYSARNEFRGRRSFLNLVLVTQVVAPVAVVVGLFQEFVWVNGVNQYWSIILTNAAFNLAFSTWILHGQFQSVPLEIEESAKMDGLGSLGIMLRISMPLIKPGLVTALIFSFIQVWNEFPVALTVFNSPSDGRLTLPVGIQQLVGLAQTNYQYLFVASLIAIIPVVILFASIEKYLVGGLTAGAVK